MTPADVAADEETRAVFLKSKAVQDRKKPGTRTVKSVTKLSIPIDKKTLEVKPIGKEALEITPVEEKMLLVTPIDKKTLEMAPVDKENPEPPSSNTKTLKAPLNDLKQIRIPAAHDVKDSSKTLQVSTPSRSSSSASKGLPTQKDNVELIQLKSDSSKETDSKQSKLEPQNRAGNSKFWNNPFLLSDGNSEKLRKSPKQSSFFTENIHLTEGSAARSIGSTSSRNQVSKKPPVGEKVAEVTSRSKINPRHSAQMTPTSSSSHKLGGGSRAHSMPSVKNRMHLFENEEMTKQTVFKPLSVPGSVNDKAKLFEKQNEPPITDKRIQKNSLEKKKIPRTKVATSVSSPSKEAFQDWKRGQHVEGDFSERKREDSKIPLEERTHASPETYTLDQSSAPHEREMEKKETLPSEHRLDTVTLNAQTNDTLAKTSNQSPLKLLETGKPKEDFRSDHPSVTSEEKISSPESYDKPLEKKHNEPIDV